MNRYIELETDTDTRTKNVIIRITPTEKDTLAAEAQRLGISISAFIRLLLRGWVDGVNFTKKVD